MAILGGIVLSVMIAIVGLSILGRTANSILHSDLVSGLAPELSAWLIGTGIGAIRGDFELVEAGMAFAIFSFLPLTQIRSAHATVDVFTSWWPARVQGVQRALIEVLFAVALVVIAWQISVGGLDKMRTGQTTLLLQFPVWWSYAASAVAATIAAVVAVYMAFVRIAEAISGRVIVASEGADH
jgi:TRAP-type C4-dicarboxylate transport system permease small subunit